MILSASAGSIRIARARAVSVNFSMPASREALASAGATREAFAESRSRHVRICVTALRVRWRANTRE